MSKINKIKRSFLEFNLHKFIMRALNKFARIYHIVFVLLLFIALLYTGFYWFRTVIYYAWPEEKKQEYKILKRKNQDFHEEEFFKVIEKSEKNKKTLTEPFNQVKDIFK